MSGETTVPNVETTQIPNVQTGIPNLPRPAPAPQPAPQPAPVVPVVPVPAPQPQAVQPQPQTVPEQSTTDVEFSSTGNEALDIAISAFATSTGATADDMDRAIANALQYNNPDLIDVAFLKERFGKNSEQAIKLAKAAVGQLVATAQRTAEAAIKTVSDLAGGQDAWAQAVSVFNGSADQHLKEAVKVLMDNGNVKAGAELLLNTVRGSGLVPNANGTLNGGSATGGVSGALSAAEFQTELAALRTKAGTRSMETGPLADEYNKLLARRRAGKQLGK